MIPGFLHALQSNLWTTALIAIFFGGSIFFHELGHFLAARLCHLKVDRFSIGFGPAIWSWRGRDGVDYRISWLPLGGYVLLPQLADLSAIEGRGSSDPAALPPVAYWPKMFVFVAGATFNVLFALALACVITVVGEQRTVLTTRVGYVRPTIEVNGAEAPSPAKLAGVRVGDRILAVDGQPVADWDSVRSDIFLGGGHTKSGSPEVVFTVERDGAILVLPIHPLLTGEDGVRQVGIEAAGLDVVRGVDPGSPAAQAGLRADDLIIAADSERIESIFGLVDHLTDRHAQPVVLRIRRGAQDLSVTLPARAKPDFDSAGLLIEPQMVTVHPWPFAQVWRYVTETFQNLASLLNPHSNIGLSKMSGPIGIVDQFRHATEVGIRVVIGFTILINVNLAILNLLPIPVLDGGQMLFATIEWIRGRRLPMNFVLTTQSVFLGLILIMICYVSVFDVGRWRRANRDDSPPPAAAPAAAKP